MAEAGAHMLAIKDMAGLVKPGHAAPLIKAIRAGAAAAEEGAWEGCEQQHEQRPSIHLWDIANSSVIH